MGEIRPELQARFGSDPDALEWARGHVQERIDWLKEASALPQASPGFAHIATWCAEFMRDVFIGNRGGYGAFDERFGRERKDEGGRTRAMADIPATTCRRFRWNETDRAGDGNRAQRATYRIGLWVGLWCSPTGHLTGVCTRCSRRGR